MAIAPDAPYWIALGLVAAAGTASWLGIRTERRGRIRGLTAWSSCYCDPPLRPARGESEKAFTARVIRAIDRARHHRDQL
jgi:hypothetical protein